ncbi:hypothetical protein [Streptomyces longwoodensis]|uniref:hypothetical protein n=1 Tax=Streptomyces longwoodensis TaxID=68231 RepID=UPI000B16C285|nr:hypothetical protein [Streptomyces longwoodensis]
MTGGDGRGPEGARARAGSGRSTRATGRDGPRLRQVLPALTGLVAVVCAATAGLALAWRTVGPAAVVSVLAAVTVTAVVAGRRFRTRVRRSAGYYTAPELAELDVPALAVAVARMLRRDGWRVLPPSEHTVPHLAARDRHGRLLDVVFRPVAEPLPDEETSCACRTRLPARRRSGPWLRLVVHRGTFSHRDVVWASRQGRTYLVDGARLRLWAAGTPLTQVAGPERTPAGEETP